MFSDPYNMPRVPTPPHTNEEQPPYPTSKRDRKGKAPQRFPSPENFQPRRRNRSKVAEKPVILSPVHRSRDDGRGHRRKVSWTEPEPELYGWEEIYYTEPWEAMDGGGGGRGTARPTDDISGFPTFSRDIGPGDPSMWGAPANGTSF